MWTTFNEWQWDLNWANPDVLVEYADIVLFLANLGVEVLRLDAIAFIWKRLGTNCQNQPEVHAITQVLRTVARIAAPALAFKAEAIVGPRDLVQYLGQGRHAGRVSDLAYHNSLMVQVWSMLATRDTVLARHALAALPPTPTTGTWITYVRCHDDIGWAIDDGDAAAVGLDGYDHRRFLADWYAGDFPGSWARGARLPAQPRHAATSGSAAPRPRWPALEAPDRRTTPRSPGCSWPTPSSPAGAASRSSGAATSSASPTTRTGPTSPATRTTTGGRTGRASTGTGPRAATTCAPSPGGSSRARPPRPGAGRPAAAARLGVQPRCSRTPTTGCSPRSARTRAGRWSASTT